jgi:hypothetical protein
MLRRSDPLFEGLRELLCSIAGMGGHDQFEQCFLAAGGDSLLHVTLEDCLERLLLFPFRVFGRQCLHPVEGKCELDIERLLGPDRQGAFGALLHEDQLPVVVAQRCQVAIIGEIVDVVTRTFLLFAGQHRQEIVAVEMDLEVFAARLIAAEKLRLDVRCAGGVFVLPRFSGFTWVQKCIRVPFHQTKNGLRTLCWRSMKFSAAATVSSSLVSIRFLMSGPVSSMVPSAEALITPRGPYFFLNSGSLGLVLELWFLLGIQVIEVAEELVEAVVARQMLVAVAQMVLAELAGGVALGFEQFGDGWIFSAQPFFGAGHADLAESGRKTLWPVMNNERPAGQFCSP